MDLYQRIRIRVIRIEGIRVRGIRIERIRISGIRIREIRTEGIRLRGDLHQGDSYQGTSSDVPECRITNAPLGAAFRARVGTGLRPVLTGQRPVTTQTDSPDALDLNAPAGARVSLGKSRKRQNAIRASWSSADIYARYGRDRIGGWKN